MSNATPLLRVDGLRNWFQVRGGLLGRAVAQVQAVDGISFAVAKGETLYRDPRHPYTAALLSAMPSTDPDHRTEQAPLAGDPPNSIDPPDGCRFHTRCPFAEELCGMREPALRAAGDRRLVACHMNDPGSDHSRAGTQGDQA